MSGKLGCLAVMVSSVSLYASAAEKSIEEVFVYSHTDRSVIAEQSLSVSKTMTDILLLPQSVEVLNRAYLNEQDSRTLSEALINVSGVSGITPSEALIADYKVRGFDAYIYYDQMPAFGQVAVSAPESLINVERIAVVKGPTSTLYGGGTGAGVGGLINISTKSPEAEASYLVGLRGGSHDTVNPYIDLNQPVNDTLGLRLTASYQDADSQFDHVDSERWSVNPSARITFSERSDLTLKSSYSKLEYREYAGIPAIGSIEPASYSIQDDRFPGASNTPHSSVENTMLTAQWNHGFNDTTGLNVSARYFKSDATEYSSYPDADFTATIAETLELFGRAGPFDPSSDPVYAVVNGSLPTEIKEYNFNANLVHQLTHGSTSHQILFGVEFDKTDNDAALYSDDYCRVYDATVALLDDPFNPALQNAYFATVDAVPYIDLSSSNSDVDFGPKPSNACFGEQDYQYKTFGVYLQDQIAVGEHWHIDLGVRWTKLESDESDVPGSDDEDRSPDNDKVIGRVGVVYSLTDAVSLFAGYGQGFQAPIGVVLADGSTPAPSESDSWELGVKWRTAGGFSGNLAYFELDRTNVATADPDNTRFQVQVGKQSSSGVELDLVWQMSEQWLLLGNFADIDAKVSDDNRLPNGDKLPRVPGTSGRLSVRHEFVGSFDGLAVQLGALYRSNQEITLPNTYKVDDYTLFDSQVSYAWNNYLVRLSANNLADKNYFQPNGFLGLPVVEAGGERTIYVSMEARF